MLFIITQVHSPEACPIHEGGTEVLHEKPENLPGLKVLGAYGAYTEHTLYYLVETDDYDAAAKFVEPGCKRCTAQITPVSKFL